MISHHRAARGRNAETQLPPPGKRSAAKANSFATESLRLWPGYTFRARRASRRKLPSSAAAARADAARSWHLFRNRAILRIICNSYIVGTLRQTFFTSTLGAEQRPNCPAPAAQLGGCHAAQLSIRPAAQPAQHARGFWLAGSLALVCWLAGWLAGSLVGSRAGWLAGSLVRWLAVWLAGCRAG